MTTSTPIPVYVAGNTTVHAGRIVGKSPSGYTRYTRLCGHSRTDRHYAGILPPDTPITCKRCLANLESAAA